MQQIRIFVLLIDRTTPISSQQIFPVWDASTNPSYPAKSPCSVEDSRPLSTALPEGNLHDLSSFTLFPPRSPLICSVYSFCVLTYFHSQNTRSIGAERLIVKQGPRSSSGTPYHQVFMVKRLNKNAPHKHSSRWRV